MIDEMKLNTDKLQSLYDEAAKQPGLLELMSVYSSLSEQLPDAVQLRPTVLRHTSSTTDSLPAIF